MRVPEGTPPDQDQPVLSLRGITKRYGRVQALHDVDLDLSAGRCHALVGENGAGKSTMIKVIGGRTQPDAGQILVAGAETHLSSPSEAMDLGLSVVPQELTYVPNLSVAENIFLGQLKARRGFVRSRAVAAEAVKVLERLGVRIDVSASLGGFSPAVRQLTMIARGLARDARLLVLDEPTAALSEQESQHLFKVIDELKGSGIAVLYVSHRMAELRRLAEDVTVLRDGKLAASWVGEGVPSDDRLVEAMVGRSIKRFFSTDRERSATSAVAMEVSNLNREDVLHDVSFSVSAGEVLAVTGLMGAGRTEVLRCIAGCDKPDSMDLRVDGKPVRVRTPASAHRAGIVLVPEERKAEGLVEMMSVVDNISLPHLRRWSKGWLVIDRLRRPDVSRVAAEVGLKPGVYDSPVSSLSGGNQQKVVLGKAVLDRPRIILLDEPTRGIDVAVKHEIYALIGALADAGTAVVIVSSDMLEVLGIADRIVVLRSGRVVGTIDGGQATERAVLELAMPDFDQDDIGPSPTANDEQPTNRSMT